MKRIFLIRHGESQHNFANNSLSGITDVAMTDLGRQQCFQLHYFFTQHPVDQVFCSPLLRAKETAAIIFPEHEIAVTNSLIELNYGSYEGFDRSKMEGSDPIIDQWEHSPADVTFPDGDNVGDHANRVFHQLISLIDQTNSSCIACISHRSTIRLIIAQVIDLPLNRFRNLPCDNCSVTELNYKSHLILKSLNTTLDYLESPHPQE
jgi:broad specificity phosphatase PhoE